MILTVTPNPALDLTYVLDGFAQGTSIRAPTALVRAGGKGVNVARVLLQTGHEVVALATAGSRSGVELEADLSAAGLDVRLVPLAGPTRRSVAIVDRSSNVTTVINEVGAAVTPDEAHAFAIAASEALRGAECVAASGSLPPGMPADVYGNLVRDAAAAGVPVVVDAVGDALVEAARAGATFVKPNRDELRQTLGEPDPVRGARLLLDLGAQNVLVSLGPDGMIGVGASDRDHVLRARFPRALPGNPTGAGDAAVAAVASCLASGAADLTTIVRRAVAWAAASVTSPVAGELHDDPASLEPQVELWSTPVDLQE